MSMPEPVWLRYAVYEDSNGVPILKGFKKDTPKEVIEQFKKERKAIEKALEEGREL